MSEFQKVQKEQNDSRVRQQSSMNYNEFVTKFEKEPKCPKIKPLNFGAKDFENLLESEQKEKKFELEKYGRPYSSTTPIIQLKLERNREYSIMEAQEQEDDEENVQFQDDDDTNDTISTISQSLTIKNKFNTNNNNNITNIQNKINDINLNKNNNNVKIKQNVNVRNKSQSEKKGPLFGLLERKRQQTTHTVYEYVM